MHTRATHTSWNDRLLPYPMCSTMSPFRKAARVFSVSRAQKKCYTANAKRWPQPAQLRPLLPSGHRIELSQRPQEHSMTAAASITQEETSKGAAAKRTQQQASPALALVQSSRHLCILKWLHPPQTPSLFPIAIVSSRPTDTEWSEPGSTLSWPPPPFFVLQILGNFLQLPGLLAGELVITIIRRKKKKYYCCHQIRTTADEALVRNKDTKQLGISLIINPLNEPCLFFLVINRYRKTTAPRIPFSIPTSLVAVPGGATRGYVGRGS